MEPPNLHVTPYLHGHAWESCTHFTIRDDKFYCTRFELSVPSRAICDDYEFAGHPYQKPASRISRKERSGMSR